MQSTKRAIKSLIDKEQKRVVLLTLNHDDELVVNGDNVSCAKLEDSDVLRQALKSVLKDEPEEDDASYNFDDRLFFKEEKCLQRRMGGEIAKILSAYLKILGFGLNAPMERRRTSHHGGQRNLSRKNKMSLKDFQGGVHKVDQKTP